MAISVPRESSVSDTKCTQFVREMYELLFQGRSVREAFEAAALHVQDAPSDCQFLLFVSRRSGDRIDAMKMEPSTGRGTVADQVLFSATSARSRPQGAGGSGAKGNPGC